MTPFCRRLPLTVLVAVASLLAACSESSGAAPSGTGMQPAPPTAEPLASPTLPLTPIPPAATPTLSPPESLSTTELVARLDPFGSTERRCALPCYNGLQVGQSSLWDALGFYAWLGIGVPDLIPGDYAAAQDGTGRLGAWLTKTTDVVQAMDAGFIPPQVDLYLEEDVLQSIYIGWLAAPPELAPARVLAELGQPEQIDLALVFSQEPPAALLRLLYPGAQAGLAYYGSVAGTAAGWHACFPGEPAGQVFLGIFAPGVPPMAGLSYSDALLPLADTLSVPRDQLAAQIAATGCVEIPADRAVAWQTLP